MIDIHVQAWLLVVTKARNGQWGIVDGLQSDKLMLASGQILLNALYIVVNKLINADW